MLLFHRLPISWLPAASRSFPAVCCLQRARVLAPCFLKAHRGHWWVGWAWLGMVRNRGGSQR